MYRVANSETLNQLRLIHPSRSLKDISSLSPSINCLQANQGQIIKVIKSFTKGSSAGPDGLSPQHLIDLITETGDCSNFIDTLTLFSNILLSGECPLNISRLLCGGRFIALKKNDGKLRPIAIGCTYRRIAAKCANELAGNSLKDMFGCLQVGVGCKSGAEAAVHANRTALSELKDDLCLVKLDMANAFNCVNRNAILTAVHQRLPKIFNFVKMCYDEPSALWFNGDVIESAEGVQQGDALGCLLFGLAIHPALHSLRSSHKIGYVDDITLVDKVSIVEADVANFDLQLQSIGLNLNYTKCEIVCANVLSPQSVFF